METIIVALIGAVSASIIAPIVTHLVGRNSSKDKAIMVLLWCKIQDAYDEANRKQGMTIHERECLQCVFDQYEKLGGNGTGKRLFDDAMKLPVLE